MKSVGFPIFEGIYGHSLSPVHRVH